MPESSRPPAPEGVALVLDGVRYDEKDNGLGGVLRASDAASGKELWTLTLYDTTQQEDGPADAIGLYFTSIEAGPGPRTITIENEVGFRYEVDLDKRSARQVGGPAPQAPPEIPDLPD